MGYLPYDVGLKTMVWIPVIIYLAVIGTFFLIKTIRAPKEVPSQKAVFRAMTLFIYLYIGTRLFFMLSDFERDPFGETPLYIRFVAFAYICGIVGFISFVYVGEKYI